MRISAALVAGSILLALAGPRPAAAATGTTLPVEAHGGSARLAFVWPAPVDVALTGEADGARLRAVTAMAPLPLDRLEALTAWVAGTDLSPDGRELLLRLRPDVLARLSRPHARMAVIELTRAPPRPAPPAAAPPLLPEPAAGPIRPPPVPVSRPDPPVAEPPQPVHGQAPAAEAEPSGEPAADSERPRVTVSAEAGADRLELRFRWHSPMPAALFQRGDRLWAAFPAAEAEVAGWRSLGRPDVAAWLEPLGTARAGTVRLFRFRLVRPAQVSARLDGTGWQIALTAPDGTSPAPADGITLDRIRDAGSLTAQVSGEVAQVRDPDSGDRLGLLMSPREGLRQPQPERLVDLELLPSLQGLAWRVLADGVRATVADGRLTITRPGGLRLSTAEEAPEPSPPSEPAGPAPTPGEATSGHPLGLGLAGMAIADPAGRQARRQQIVDGLHGLAGLPRAEARLELARLYLADALGPEARTALDLIEARDIAGPAAAPQRLSRLALGGAAEALSGRPDPALVKLLDHALDEDREVALWRAYAAALASRRALADQEWARSGGLPDSYPDPLRRRLGLELAALLLEDADPAAARTLLERLQGLSLEPEERARLALMEGKVQARAGASLAAEQSFAMAAAGDDPQIATQAAFLLTGQQLERGELSAERGLAELALQRPRWRGHPWRARMLARLAALQVEAGRPVAAIGTWREAIAANGDSGAAAGLGADLRRQLAATLADEALPTTTRLALALAHGRALDGDARAGEIRARLALAAARLGLAATADKLLATAGPAADAVRAELARTLAETGQPDGAFTPANSQRAPPNPRAQRAAAAGVGDWAGVAALAHAGLANAPSGRPLTAEQAESAVWLGIAQGRLGHDAAAVDSAAGYLDRIEGPADRALLELATLPSPPDDDAGRLATAADAFASAIRTGLATLPRLGGTPPVRTASAR